MAPTLLADLGGPGSSNPSTVVEVNGIGYFTADDGIHGRELWRTDGTPEGTQMVRDINPGNSSSSPIELVNAGGMLYFVANDGGSGMELWKSDGTVEGTVLVSDLYLGSYASNPSELTAVGSVVYFSARDAADDYELYRSDGTAGGTYRVRNINTQRDSFPQGLTNVGGTLYFVANNGSDRDIWRSNGTSAGTTRVFKSDFTTLWSGTLQNVNGSLYFVAYESTSNALWSLNGSTPQRVFTRGTNPTSFEGSVYFTSGSQLYRRIDATSVELTADVNPGGTASPIESLMVAGDKMFFVAQTPGHGEELWVSDGTTAGTMLVRDIVPPNVIHGVQDLAAVGDTVYFTFYKGSDTGQIGGAELWKSDGTSDGTTLVKDIWPGPDGADVANLANVGGMLFFAAIHPLTGAELWKSDGTEVGTTLVRDVNAVGNADSQPTSFTPAGAVTYFVATTVEHGTELWKTDGTSHGTALVKDLDPGRSGSNPKYLTEVAGILYFVAATRSGLALWKTDGTDAGTRQITDQTAFDIQYFTAPPLNVNGTLYFQTRNADYEYRLWTSDGTPEGTRQVEGARELVPDNYQFERTNSLFSIGNDLYYVGGVFDSFVTSELWKYDQVRRTHQKIADVRPPVQDSFTFRSSGSVLYFSGSDRQAYGNIWKTDGTPDGTVLASNAAMWPNGNFVIAGGQLFMSAEDAEHRTELWVSDGTPEGTRLVKDILLGIDSGYPSALTAVGDWVYFVARDPAGYKLWKSDGTEEGTRPVVDVPFLSLGGLTNVNGALYFAVEVPGHTAQLWSSDGTAAGTNQVGTIGFNSSTWFTNVNGALFFAGDDGVHGSEPWVVTPPAVARLFYNNSAFDQSPASTMDDNDAALAVDKLPYLPGNGRATGENVSSYSKGINGLFVDLAPGHGEISAEDFVFRMGTSADPASWSAAPAPLSIAVRPGAGIGGHDRIEIVFADGAITNTWLEVTVRGNDARGGFHANTGLDASSVFYFGSRVGDTFFGNSPASAVTSAADALRIRNAGAASVGSGSRFDINRDGVVSAADELLARNNPGVLLMLDLPALVDAPAPSSAADPLAAAIASALTSASDAAGESDDSERQSNREGSEARPTIGATSAVAAGGDALQLEAELQLAVDVAVSQEIDSEAEDNFLLDALLHS